MAMMTNDFTLQGLLDRGHTLMRARRLLNRVRNDGLIFYPEDLEQITVDMPIEIYMAIIPLKSPYCRAFPVHLNNVKYFHNPELMLRYCSKHFTNYYGVDCVWTVSDMAQLHQRSSKRFMWYYLGV